MFSYFFFISILPRRGNLLEKEKWPKGEIYRRNHLSTNFLGQKTQSVVSGKNLAVNYRFFLHAPEKEKRRVFEDAARLANKDQRALVENINKLQHKTS